MDSFNRVLILAALAGVGLILSSPRIEAGYSNVTHTDLKNVIHAQTIAASGTFTQTLPFAAEALTHTNTQTVQIQGTGTSPNFKVELLISIDGTNYAKPEIGGDLGTFTDQNLHIIALASPLSVGHKLKITEMGGAHSVVIEASELSQ